jgi:mono/diheme cytochrome c family protein
MHVLPRRAARGGIRGPDLTTGSWNHGGADSDLFETISHGIPGTAMPANKLTEDEIWQVVTYLGTLQPPTAATGDRSRGETLFFGSGRCSSCHIVNGRGGRLGPELSTVDRPVARLPRRVDPRRRAAADAESPSATPSR